MKTSTIEQVKRCRGPKVPRGAAGRTIVGVDVWIVEDDNPYETTYVHGVFSTIEKAKTAFPGDWRLDSDTDCWSTFALALYRVTVDEVFD